MNLISGFSSTKETNWEPHSLQNPLETLDPAVPDTVKNLRSPSILSEFEGTKRIVALPLPVIF